jgi:hypothetical protein
MRELVRAVNAAIIGHFSGVHDPLCWLPYEVREPRE